MNILLLSQMAGSPAHGMVFRNYALAREWILQGHKVTIVASGFSHTRTKQPETKGRVTEQNIDGIRYIWLWGPKYKQSGTVGRVISMFAYAFQAWLMPLPLEDDYDIVISSSPSPFAIYPAARFAKKYSSKLIYDIRDLWPLTLIELGNISPQHPFIKLAQHAEDFACRLSDLVIAVPRNCEAYLKKHGLKTGRFLHISNGAILNSERDYPPLPLKHIDELKQLRQQGYFLVGYAGAIGMANALDSLVFSLKNSDSRIHAVIMGHGGHLSSLKKLANELGVSNRVHFLAPVNRDQVYDFMNRIDVAYLGLQKAPLFSMGVSPTKLNDYMLASKPILYAVGDPANAVEESGCGISCEAENTLQISCALEKFLMYSKKELKEIGRKGNEWLMDNQLVSKQAEIILEALTEAPNCQFQKVGR